MNFMNFVLSLFIWVEQRSTVGPPLILTLSGTNLTYTIVSEKVITVKIRNHHSLGNTVLFPTNGVCCVEEVTICIFRWSIKQKHLRDKEGVEILTHVFSESFFKIVCKILFLLNFFFLYFVLCNINLSLSLYKIKVELIRVLTTIF